MVRFQSLIIIIISYERKHIYLQFKCYVHISLAFCHAFSTIQCESKVLIGR